MKKLIIPFILILALVSCNRNPKKVTAINDYEKFLTKKPVNVKEAVLEIDFWRKRLDKDSTKISVLSKLAAANTSFFNATGKIEYLIDAEILLKKAVNRAGIGKTGKLRSLAHNYITQHKFKEAATVLNQAYTISKQRDTELMLFDVNMELGNYSDAENMLNKVKNVTDFNYLIRVSKWMDYKGDLDSAIRYFEKATKIAEAGKLKGLRNWSYSNIADYYGHAGDIEKSYAYYLKALEINSDDVYSLRKIAWIAFSHEKNTQKAYDILNALKEKYEAPDIYLMEAEIASFEGNEVKKQASLTAYFNLVNTKDYGEMYNKYSALLFNNDLKDFSKAEAIAMREIENRPTPQSYDLLAWTYYSNGEYEKALKINRDHVNGKTFEPEVLYHQAEILKANAKIEEAKKLKKELENSLFELGPGFSKKIAQL